MFIGHFILWCLFSLQLQQKASQAAEKAAAADQEYKDVLKATNTKQQDHYHTEMPNVLNVRIILYLLDTI